MERQYNVGIDSNSVTIQIKTGTASTCYTSVSQFLGGGQKILKAESSVTDNGVIAKKNIGVAADLKNTKLIVQTVADFSALADEIVQAIKQDPHSLKTYLVIEYLFTGGFSGNQIYDYDYDDFVISSSGKMVIVTKHIDLIV